MANNSTTDDRVGPTNRNLCVNNVNIGDAICTRRDIAQVTCVALLVSRGAVSLARWVEMWASGEAAVGSVPKLRTNFN